MKKSVELLSIATFLFATVTVAALAYEGMVLRWFTLVRDSIIVTDILFVLATIAGIFFYKGNKTLFRAHLDSAVVILAAVAIHLIYGANIPKILFLLWIFYILYFYGIIVCKKLWQKK